MTQWELSGVGTQAAEKVESPAKARPLTKFNRAKGHPFPQVRNWYGWHSSGKEWAQITHQMPETKGSPLLSGTYYPRIEEQSQDSTQRICNQVTLSCELREPRALHRTACPSESPPLSPSLSGPNILCRAPRFPCCHLPSFAVLSLFGSLV